jgi:hypothetical protein
MSRGEVSVLVAENGALRRRVADLEVQNASLSKAHSQAVSAFLSVESRYATRSSGSHQPAT